MNWNLKLDFKKLQMTQNKLKCTQNNKNVARKQNCKNARNTQKKHKTLKKIDMQTHTQKKTKKTTSEQSQSKNYINEGKNTPDFWEFLAYDTENRNKN